VAFTLEEIKNDILTLDVSAVYKKYFLSDDNWYFENILSASLGCDSVAEVAKKFNSVISNGFGISFQDIIMVGSGRLGYSLTPTKNNTDAKLFKSFCVNGKERKMSDIDIALISETLFNRFWHLLRTSYRAKYSAQYNYIPRAIYRGYISENHLQEIDGCRKEWRMISFTSKKVLHENLFIQHDINYRLYRNWFDFEDYHIQALKTIKRGVS
jgi:hypothetical protein